MCHRGVDTTMHEIKKTHYWPKIKETITAYIQKCKECIKNDQKSLGGQEFVKTSHPLEKVGIDLMMINQKKPILTFIDYFTRLVRVKILKSKEEEEIRNGISEIFNELGAPEILVSDHGKEFVNTKVATLLQLSNCAHHKTSVGKHQSNGRIERLHRTLWQSIRKLEAINASGRELNEKIKHIINSYNNSKHRGIGMSPNEAWTLKNSEKLSIANKEGRYSEEFKVQKRETFNVNDEIYIKNAAIELQTKDRNLYEKRGKIVKILENDSYLIEGETGKIFKRNHYSLKKIEN